MNRDRRWIYIAILSVVVAVSWVGVSAVGRLRKSTISPDVAKAASPLDPSIDRSIFDSLSKRK